MLLPVAPDQSSACMSSARKRMRWPSRSAVAMIAISTVLVGCASKPRSDRAAPPRAWATDGPGDSPPADLASIPDAVPTIEPLRSGPMRPYRVNGQSYQPMTADLPLVERGLATWYGRKYHGRMTAGGEPYDMYAMTAAHPTMPLPSYARVRNLANAREVIVRINDRGPFHPGRVIDLSYTAAYKLDLLRGAGMVEVERITHAQIRDGSWGRQLAAPQPRVLPVDPALAAAPAPPPFAAQAMPVAAAPAVPAAPSAPLTPAAAPSAPPAPAAPAGSAAPATSAPEAVPLADPLAPTAEPTVMSLAADPRYWVQLGAFRQRDGASSFRQRVGADLHWLAPALAVFDDAGLHRLQAGPYTDLEQATQVAQRVREQLQLVPIIVERR